MEIMTINEYSYYQDNMRNAIIMIFKGLGESRVWMGLGESRVWMGLNVRGTAA